MIVSIEKKNKDSNESQNDKKLPNTRPGVTINYDHRRSPPRDKKILNNDKFNKKKRQSSNSPPPVIIQPNANVPPQPIIIQPNVNVPRQPVIIQPNVNVPPPPPIIIQPNVNVPPQPIIIQPNSNPSLIETSNKDGYHKKVFITPRPEPVICNEFENSLENEQPIYIIGNVQQNISTPKLQVVTTPQSYIPQSSQIIVPAPKFIPQGPIGHSNGNIAGPQIQVIPSVPTNIQSPQNLPKPRGTSFKFDLIFRIKEK